MKIFLESTQLSEIEQTLSTGLIDGCIIVPGGMAPNLSVELEEALKALSEFDTTVHVELSGEHEDELFRDAHHYLDIGLKKEQTVFRLPISWEALKAGKRLQMRGFETAFLLVSTLQQGLMSAKAGSSWAVLNFSLLENQGYDSAVICRSLSRFYAESTFSTGVFASVKTMDQAKTAIESGAGAISLGAGLFAQFCETIFSKEGRRAFDRFNRLNTSKVRDVLRKVNPQVRLEQTILEAVVEMSRGGMGAVAVVNNEGKLAGVFTDGDLRRLLQTIGEDIFKRKMGDLQFKTPLTVDADELLSKAAGLLHEKKVDNILVVSEGTLVGMLDIQDIP